MADDQATPDAALERARLAAAVPGGTGFLFRQRQAATGQLNRLLRERQRLVAQATVPAESEE